VDEVKTIYVKNREQWRSWLQEHHGSEKEIWLILYKKNSGKPSLPYEDVVEEAVSFGWIDGKVKRIDDEKYMRRYSPRTAKSAWSESNIAWAEKMIAQGRMTPSGLQAYQAVKPKDVSRPGDPET
jgi:uncharacterized protein YdeI (YjbR/CyaY-like superfamily)